MTSILHASKILQKLFSSGKCCILKNVGQIFKLRFCGNCVNNQYLTCCRKLFSQTQFGEIKLTFYLIELFMTLLFYNLFTPSLFLHHVIVHCIYTRVCREYCCQLLLWLLLAFVKTYPYLNNCLHNAKLMERRSVNVSMKGLRI